MVGGFSTNLYGKTCGIDFYNPYSWGNSFIMIGSPWCQSLASFSYFTNKISESIVFHSCTAGVGMIICYLPIGFGGRKYISNRIA